jgi:DNA-binding CsgD family transcriptional regulator
VTREDPLAELVALGKAPPGTSFTDLIEAARPALQRLAPSTSMNAQWLSAERTPRGLYTHVLQPGDLREYVLEYWKSDPMTPQGMLADGAAITLAQASRGLVIKTNPYFNELLPRLDVGRIVGASCAVPGGEMFQIAAQRWRGAEDFGRLEIKRWSLAAMEIVRAIAALSFRERATGEETCGVLLFDRGAQLLHADEGSGPLFARLVAEGHGPWLASIVREVATLARPARDRLLTVPIDGAALQLRLSLVLGVGPRPLVAAGLSLEIDPCERVRKRAEQLGLSPRTASVVAHVARGLTNREVAHALGVKPVTVRDHLRHAFSVLGVHSRTELVSRLLRSD